MGEQNLNLVNVVGKDALDLPGAEFPDIAERLIFEPVLQRDADVFERVVCADVREGKPLAVGKRIDCQADKNCRDTQDDKLKVRQLVPGERNNQLVQEKVGDNARNDSHGGQHRSQRRVLFVFPHVGGYGRNHRTSIDFC